MSKDVRILIDKIKSINNNNINEEDLNNKEEKKFQVNKNKFKLFVNNQLVAETGYNIEEPPDKFFNEKYLTLFNLKTFEQFQNRGYAKYLIQQIFIYTKNNLNLNLISLIVDKNNPKAYNLYINTGFEIFMEYEDSYALIKKL